MTTTKQKVNTLWEEFRKAINATYHDGQATVEDCSCLRDYVEELSWHDDLAKLLGRETANERQHRRGEQTPSDFSVDTASKLILMNCASKGAKRDAMPKASEFLVFRQTAVEAEVIGWLVRDHLDAVWHEELAKMDYAKLMHVEVA